MDLQIALQTAKNPNGDMTAYREALEYLVDHRDTLPYRVFIVLPGGLGGNSDPAWDKVKAGSHERCSCGNERAIMPANPRMEYEAGEKVTIKPGEMIYLRPVGGDRESAYVRFENDSQNRALSYLLDPFGPLVLSIDIFDTKGWYLDSLAEIAGPTAVLSIHIKDMKTPLVRFDSVDLETGSVVLELDKDVEVFDPELEKTRHE